ncbi:ABC transporter substrate-binding protein [Roseococcus sp. YIM B11640]|uniref:ABC transporter substrate-binding protein n=1 Tax=Roseococcus sp. YIM B11640 TaxID=3133973 RepID=UPI003C79B3C5
MHRRHVLAGAGALSAASLAGPALAQPANARVVRHVPHANLSTIDPFWSSAFIVRNHGYLIYDQLYGLDNEFKPQPQMVEGHTVENDGLLWKFTLRENLKFHDNEPVRGRDVIASIRRWARRDAFGQRLLTQLVEMRSPTDRTFEIQLNKPFPKMIDAFAKITTPCLFIMPERVAQTDPFQQITDTTGCGPYRFVRNEWNPGSKAVYEKWAGYVPRPQGATQQTAGPKVAHFERVEWQIITDAATAAAALQSGETDWWEQPSGDFLPLLGRNRNLKVEVADVLGLIGIIRPNHLTEPFNNPAVRRAVITALNQLDIMTPVIGSPELIRDNVGFFAPASPLASDVGLDRYKKSVDQARRELQAAGAMGAKLVLMNATDLSSINASTLVVADTFRRMGFNVDYVATDWGTVLQRRATKNPLDQGGWSAFCTFWSAFDHWTPAGHNSIRGNGAEAWVGWPEIPELEAKRNEWFDAPDLAAEQAAARDMQRIAFDTVPYMPTGQYFQPTAYRSNITGVLRGPPQFHNIRRG